FALLTALGLTVAAVAIVLLVRDLYAEQGEQRAITKARLTAQVLLQGELRPSDLTGPVTAARRRALNRLFAQHVVRDGIDFAAIYSRTGVPTYSTGSKRPVTTPDLRRILRDALGGKVIADTGQATTGDGRVLRTYVPVVIGPPKTAGVVALAQDYGP